MWHSNYVLSVAIFVLLEGKRHHGNGFKTGTVHKISYMYNIIKLSF